MRVWAACGLDALWVARVRMRGRFDPDYGHAVQLRVRRSTTPRALSTSVSVSTYQAKLNLEGRVVGSCIGVWDGWFKRLAAT